MAINYEDRIEMLQSGKITYLEFLTEGEYQSTFLNWCNERQVEPSDESAARFIEELEYDMFEFQSNTDLHGFFAL